MNKEEKINIETTVGQRLMQTRKHLGLSQKNVSESTGIARSTISKLENDELKDYLDLAMFYLRTYNISLEWILAGLGGSEVVVKDPNEEESGYNEKLSKPLSENEKQILERILQIAQIFEEQQGISFEKFCKEINLDNKRIESYYNGRARLTFDHIKLLGAYFSVNPMWLLTGEGEIFTKNLIEPDNAIKDSFYLKQEQLSNNEKQVLKRLLEVVLLLEEKFILSFEKASTEIGLNLLSFHSRERVTIDQLINVCNNYSINGHWLLTGNGEMLSDEKTAVRNSLVKVQFLAEDFEFFEKNIDLLNQKLTTYEFDSYHAKKYIFSHYHYFESTNFPIISILKSKPLLNLTEIDLKVIGLERSYDNINFPNLFFTKDFNDHKIFFNQIGDIIELRGFRWPLKEHYQTEEDYKKAVEEIQELDDSLLDQWQDSQMFKFKDILTTEELINEVFHWKLKWENEIAYKPYKL